MKKGIVAAGPSANNSSFMYSDGFNANGVGVSGDAVGHTAGDEDFISGRKAQSFLCNTFCFVKQNLNGGIKLTHDRSNAPGKG